MVKTEGTALAFDVELQYDVCYRLASKEEVNVESFGETAAPFCFDGGDFGL